MCDSDHLLKDRLPLRNILVDVSQFACKQDFVWAVKAVGVSDTYVAHSGA